MDYRLSRSVKPYRDPPRASLGLNAFAMRHLLRSIDFVLLLITAVGLIAGLMFAAFGRSAIAQASWTAGALPVLLALSISIVQELRRRETGIDVLALLAIGFALALGEHLTAAVISLMLASGRALENYAKERARREMTALLAHAPRYANRFEAGEWRRVELDAIHAGDRLLVCSGEFVPGLLASGRSITRCPELRAQGSGKRAKSARPHCRARDAAPPGARACPSPRDRLRGFRRI